MHKGRHYPFHPDYWSTESWFWPGFVPWKMRAAELPIGVTLFGCPFGTPVLISEPGEPSSTTKSIDYAFNLVATCLIKTFVVTMERTGSFGAYRASWTVAATYWDDSIESQTMTQEYPQRVVLSPVFVLTIPPVVPGPPITQHARFFPATYAEGGSPWPRVPPGPPLLVDLSDLTPEV